MDIKLSFGKALSTYPLIALPSFQSGSSAPSKSDSKKSGKAVKSLQLDISHWPKEVQESFKKLMIAKDYRGENGETLEFSLPSGTLVLVYGMGDRNHFTAETLRRDVAIIFKHLQRFPGPVTFCLESFNVLKSLEKTAQIMAESLGMTCYSFNDFRSEKDGIKLKEANFHLDKSEKGQDKIQKVLKKVENLVDSIRLAKDLVNSPPNTLHSEAYADLIVKDVKENLGGKAKVQVLGKDQLTKEKMGMFLSVNAGSFYGPRLVHLTYEPKGKKQNTKHVVLIGKGLTFDTGGLSIKPAASMVNMKNDMAGSATVYAAFRAAVLNQVDCKVTCLLGITDNAVSNTATMPDAIVRARNGKYVEIVNTDAEGRLVLGDCLHYACDMKPDAIIDVATLTGAILVSLGHEVCGLFANDSQLAQDILRSAKASDEYMWQLPIIPEYKKDLKSPAADLRNIGSNRYAGSGKAAAFLQEFVQEGCSWAHLDIAGVADGQNHLPYCSSKGASGLIIRTLAHFLEHATV